MTEKAEFPYMTCRMGMPEITHTTRADLDLAARLEVLQQRLREEQAALPKPLGTVHTCVSFYLEYAIEKIEFARATLICGE